MPGMCSVPGCKGYKKARSRGVVFHSLPTRDPERCRKWLKAIENPKFDENTPVSKYGNIRVCSQHFKPEDYEPDIQAELMKTTPRKILKSHVIPSVFSGGHRGDFRVSLSAPDSSQVEVKAPSAADQVSTSVFSGVDSVLQWASVLNQVSSLGVKGTRVDTVSPSPFSLPVPIGSGAVSNSSRSPAPAELSESLHNETSADRLSESFPQETELSWTETSDENTEKDLRQSKTIVNDSCLMELFKKCQTCGQTITKKKVSHCGAQKKVKWSCLGGHRGIWMSTPHLSLMSGQFPEIHLLMALSVLFSGGTFTHFKKWAKHLHLNFMGYKTFFEIQKAYLKPETNWTEQEGIFSKGVSQEPEDALLHMSDPTKKTKTRSRRREKGVLSSRSSYEKRSTISLTCTGTCHEELTAPSSLGHVSASNRGKKHQQCDDEHQSETTHLASEVDWLEDSFDEMEVTIDEDACDSVKNRLSDMNSDLENVTEKTDDSCDEDVYVPIIPRRSSTSELLLECEEEELEPWQKQTSHICLKDEDDGDSSNDKTDCKPDLSLLQRNAESPQHVDVDNQVFIVASPQLTSNAEFIGSLGTRCHVGSSFSMVSAAPPDLFQKVVTAAVKPEAYDVHTPEMHQISNNPVSLSSVQSPAIYTASSNQPQSEQSESQTLSLPLSLPCFTVLELESTGASNKT